MNPFARKTSAQAMDFFDRLPANLRKAVAQADIPYDPEWLAEQLAAGRRASSLAWRIRKRTSRRVSR